MLKIPKTLRNTETGFFIQITPDGRIGFTPAIGRAFRSEYDEAVQSAFDYAVSKGHPVEIYECPRWTR